MGRCVPEQGPREEELLTLTPESGVIPRIIRQLFEGLQSVDKNAEVTIKVMYVEIYLETIRDLLEPTSLNLEVRRMLLLCVQ